MASPVPSPSVWARLVAYFRARPILVLLLFSPGLIEYLSGSSQLADIVLNPAFFILQILLNCGLYGPGVLLIREAKLRWNKGWATVLLLGLAYGILEEGIALSTMFDPLAAPTVSANLGVYGHFVGVSWVWAVQIDIIHALLSISVPILLLDLTLPETRGRSLLIGRQVPWTFLILGVDVTLLILLVWKWVGFWAGLPLIVGGLAVVGVFILAGWLAPKDLLVPRSLQPRSPPLSFAFVGFLGFLTFFLSGTVFRSWALPPISAIVMELLLGGVVMYWVLQNVGVQNNERQLVALIGGLFTMVMFAGVISQIELPIVVVADVAFLLLLRWLWKKYPENLAIVGPTPVPATPGTNAT